MDDDMDHNEPTRAPFGALLHIRSAGPADAAVVLAMIREIAAQQGLPAVAAPDEASLAQTLADAEVTVLLAVADESGAPIGFVSALRRPDLASSDGVVTVGQWYVRPSARGSGVGTALISALAERFDGTTMQWDLAEGDIAGQRSAIAFGARLRRAVIASWRRPGPANAVRPTS